MQRSSNLPYVISLPRVRIPALPPQPNPASNGGVFLWRVCFVTGVTVKTPPDFTDRQEHISPSAGARSLGEPRIDAAYTRLFNLASGHYVRMMCGHKSPGHGRNIDE